MSAMSFANVTVVGKQHSVQKPAMSISPLERLSSHSASPSSSTGDLEKAADDDVSETWTPEKKEWFIMISLSVISFMVALDASILVTVLPVRPEPPPPTTSSLADHCG